MPAYTSWSADESPKWLGSRGRAAEADALLAKASAAAGIPAPPAFPPPPPPSPQEKPATLGSVLRLSQTWAMALLWFAASANYYGISLAASSLSRGGNVYLTAALSAAMEIPAALLSNYVLEIPWMGRRLSTTALYASGGFMCLLIPVAPPFLTRYLAIAGKTLVSAAFDNVRGFPPPSSLPPSPSLARRSTCTATRCSPPASGSPRPGSARPQHASGR